MLFHPPVLQYAIIHQHNNNEALLWFPSLGGSIMLRAVEKNRRFVLVSKAEKYFFLNSRSMA